MLVKDVCNYLDKRFPKEIAEDSDLPRIGLIIGNENIVINNILLTLDLNYEVVLEAIINNCNMIIAHHPYIFEPIYKINFASPKGKVLELMFKHQISLFVMHTNLDVGVGGVNDVLVKKLNLQNIKVINNNQKGSFLRVGETSSSFEKMILKVKECFNLTGVRYLGPLDKDIKKVGIIGGAGGSSFFINEAVNEGCDCYITGEFRLNCSQLAEELGLAIIEVNHGIEKFVFESLKIEFVKDFKDLFDYKNEIYVSNCETDKMKTK